MKNLTTILFVIFIINISNAQLTYYNTSNSGLISDRVLSIAIDNNGNKWFGTDNGVSKFNGLTWTTYNQQNSGIVNDSINDIKIDLQGNLWFGTASGVSKFDGTNWTSYTVIDGLVDDFINAIEIDSSNNVWFATGWGVSKFNGTTCTNYTTSNSGIASDSVRAISVDHQGNLWFSVGFHISKFDGTNWTTYNIPSGPTWGYIGKSTIDSNNKKWFGTDNGISVLDGTNWSTHNIASVFSMFSENNGNVWVGSLNGAKKFDGTTWTDFNTNHMVFSIAIDAEGNKWFGDKYGSGITLLSNCGIPPSTNICYVEFDPATSKNSINWPTNLPANVDSIKIFNEVSTNVWDQIGTIAANQNHFIDYNSSPINQSYSYKISISDTCNNESSISSAHTTITLFAAYDIGTNTYGFTWSPYQGLPVANYYLYGVTLAGTETLLGSVPGNQYFYNVTNPFPGFVKYFVGFNTPTCDSKTNHLVKSNTYTTATSISELSLNQNLVSCFPNPVCNILHIKTDLQIEKVEITDLSGRIIKISVQKEIDLSKIENGFYYINTYTSNGLHKDKIFKIN